MLCRELGLLLGCPDMKAAVEGRFQIDGVGVGLYFEPDLVADTLFCYVDLGEIDDRHRLQTYETLLKLNLMTGSKTRSVFALDSESKHAMLISHLWADESVGARRLTETLRVYAAQAVALRGKLLRGALPPRGDLLAVMNSFA